MVGLLDHPTRSDRTPRKSVLKRRYLPGERLLPLLGLLGLLARVRVVVAGLHLGDAGDCGHHEDGERHGGAALVAAEEVAEPEAATRVVVAVALALARDHLADVGTAVVAAQLALQ